MPSSKSQGKLPLTCYSLSLAAERTLASYLHKSIVFPSRIVLISVAQCDETKPACNRCSKSNHECNYRDQADLFFRNQTAFAAQRAEDSWRKRSKSHRRTLSSSSDSGRSPSNESISPTT